MWFRSQTQAFQLSHGCAQLVSNGSHRSTSRYSTCLCQRIWRTTRFVTIGPFVLDPLEARGLAEAVANRAAKAQWKTMIEDGEIWIVSALAWWINVLMEVSQLVVCKCSCVQV
jgi:hypothetical protein